MTPGTIPIIIPSYEPDENLVKLITELVSEVSAPIVIVNDGSGPSYDEIFSRVEDLGAVVIKHPENKGKGRALKTAFSYCLENMPDMTGSVTADSDGQHTPEDIKKVMDALTDEPGSLILGCRDFDKENVPRNSRFGNKLTRKVCRFLCDLDVTDTQTGLRGIPAEFMKHLLNVSGEKFEFETRMLIETKGRVDIKEVEIKTVYDSKEDHKTHFRPVQDSLRIYSIFGEIFLRFLMSSVMSSVIDLVAFSLACRFLRDGGGYYVAVSTVIARVISATANFTINYRFVFKSNANPGKSMLKYFTLAVLQMLCSAGLTTLGVALLPGTWEVYVKVVVDTILFFISYKIQQRIVFD